MQTKKYTDRKKNTIDPIMQMASSTLTAKSVVIDPYLF